jgi:hypothetical protein
MKTKFLQKIKQNKPALDKMVSTFMLFKELNGNGVGAGKWFENLLEQFIVESIDGFYAYKLDLSNSDWCVHDIIISENEDILQNNGKRIIELKEIAQSKFNTISERMICFTELLNDEFGPCLGVSAKTYKEWDVQITTSHEPREFLESKHSEVINEELDITEVINLLSEKTNESSLILALNTFEDSSTYRLTNLDMNCLSDIISKVEFKQLKKHSRYFLVKENGEKVIDFKYGGKTANPYQRGMWMCNKRGATAYHGLDEFETITSGSYTYNGDKNKWIKDLFNHFLK